MNKFQICKLYAALSACGLLTAMPVAALPMSLAQAPAGSIAVTPPAPNLILTIDNSNSMNGTDAGQVGSRMANLKNALATAFSTANVAEGSIRLGWNTINPLTWNGGVNWTDSAPTNGGEDCSNFSSVPKPSNNCGLQGNIVRPLTAAHRTNFLNWVNTRLAGAGNTPTLHGYFNALKQYDQAATNVNSPWAEDPGTKVGDYLTCRKSYVMLLTDGDYNRYDSAGVTLGGSADLDSVTRTLGDGTTTYNPAQPYGKIYRQAQNNNFLSTNHLEQNVVQTNFNTLSDLAFHYWAKDADSNTGNNNVKELYRVTANENGIDKFWNPKNNPATWQHVSTYTIGYGATASGWATSPKLTGTETLHSSADLQKLMLAGDPLAWPFQNLTTVNIQQEMMHAAINGRGKFYPARTGQDVVDAIKDLIQDVTPVAEQHVTSATGSSLSGYVDSSAFFTKFDSEKWSGDLSAVTILAGGGVSTGPGPWGVNTAASLLNAKAPGSRNILTSQSTPFAGSTFTWASLSADQQTALRGTAVVNATTTALGTSRLNYLRGDRTAEPTLRSRASKLGDIVNSNVWFMKGVPNAGYPSADYLNYVAVKKAASRKDTVFVGANDGMLHGFDATNGNELFAYVPQGAYANLASLADPAYAHKYFVDGSPFTSDYCKTYDASVPPKCTAWGTALVGFMGAGSKGYFMLDVSDPASMSGSKVIMDKTVTTDPDLGYIFQKPVTEKSNPLSSRQIARMNNGKWALVTGNGYNSADEKAVLIIQYMDGSAPTKIYATTTAGGANGLSAPRLFDLNGDGRVDVAYAGDLKGNLYKFDLGKTSPSDWAVAGGAPMFRAKQGGTDQPITTAPAYMIHPSGGLVVTFGTGQNLTTADRSDTTVQSFYGVYDNGFEYLGTGAGGVKVTAAADKNLVPWSPYTGLRTTDMVQQTFTALGSGWTSSSNTTLDSDGDGVVDENFVDVIGTTKRGWYIDLPVQRQRVLRNPGWFDGELLMLYSDVPAVAAASADPCQAVSTSSASYFTGVLNGLTGNKPVLDPFAGLPPGTSLVPSDLPTLPTDDNDGRDLTCVAECTVGNQKLVKFGRYFKTPSWRQMQ